MISKNKLKELAAYRQQRHCDEEAVFVVEGPKMASEAMASGFDIRVVCGTGEWLAEHRTVVAGEVYEVGASELERLSSMRSPNGVWMLVERSQQRPTVEAASPMVIALDHVQDPGNMGTIMRTADWYGVRRIVCSDDTASCYNPKVVQASMGAVFRTEVEYVDLPRWLAECGMAVYGATLEGEDVSTMPRPVGAAVLLIGNESRGISQAAMRAVTHPVKIPNRGGTAESLNAAVATAILIDRLWNN